MKNIKVILLLLGVGLIQASTDSSRLKRQNEMFDWERVMHVMCHPQAVSASGPATSATFLAAHRALAGDSDYGRQEESVYPDLEVVVSKGAGERHTPDMMRVSPACVVLHGVQSEQNPGMRDIPGYIPDEQLPVERVVATWVENEVFHDDAETDTSTRRLTEAALRRHDRALQQAGDEDSIESSTGSNPLACKIRRDSLTRLCHCNAGQNLRERSPSVHSEDFMDRSFRDSSQHAQRVSVVPVVSAHQVTATDQSCCAKIIALFMGCCSGE